MVAPVRNSLPHNLTVSSNVHILQEACRRHADGKLSGDATIGTCGDAARLDLGRVGTIPDPRFMSTSAGKAAAMKS